MTKQEAIEILRDTPIDIRSTREDDIHTKYATAQLIAIECIEKQIPKKPNKDVDTTWGIRKKVNVCPKCDYYLGNYAFIDTKAILKKNKVTFCETCGQAIDWNEVE